MKRLGGLLSVCLAPHTNKTLSFFSVWSAKEQVCKWFSSCALMLGEIVYDSFPGRTVQAAFRKRAKLLVGWFGRSFGGL